jgi:hypothetical protein
LRAGKVEAVIRRLQRLTPSNEEAGQYLKELIGYYRDNAPRSASFPIPHICQMIDNPEFSAGIRFPFTSITALVSKRVANRRQNVMSSVVVSLKIGLDTQGTLGRVNHRYT